MERAHLLEELAELKRIIENHENSCAVGNKTPGDDGSSKEVPSCYAVTGWFENTIEEQDFDNNKSTIYVNPKRLNAIQLEKESKVTTGKINQDSLLNMKNVNKGVSKVYINPNFTKSIPVLECQTHQKIPNIYKINHSCNKSNSKQTRFLRRITEADKSLYKGHFPQTEECKKKKAMWNLNCSNQEVQKSSSLITNNQRIFINPEFTIPTKFQHSSLPCLISQKSVDTRGQLRPENHDAALHSKHKNHKQRSGTKDDSETTTTSYFSSIPPSEGPVSNVNKKRNIYMNQYKAVEMSLTGQQSTNSVEGNSISSNKIFFNPKFERGIQESNNIYTNNLRVIQRDQNETPESSSSYSTTENSFSSTNVGNNHLGGTDISLNEPVTVLSFLNGCPRGPDLQKAQTIKVTSKRKRAFSTSLISASPTKLIRRRKSSKNLAEPILKTVLNQPTFLSKTKLVRCSPSKKVSNGIVTKSKVKRVVPKVLLQCLTPDKINKLRKHSFINNISNLVNTVPKTAVVTKIKSKDGKSLKLIRKNIESNRPNPELCRVKSVHITHKRKHLKHQASKIALCAVQNKLKKNQFSKINVPIKRKSTQSFVHNKYVYKNKDATRKILTKTSVLDKKRKSNTMKIQGLCNTSERTKFLRSKYKLIRKQASNSGNRPARPCKGNTPNKVFPIRPISKRKWKSQNNLSKGNCKRKVLSIVNIGGVFYRCSRNSLCRNKSTSKGVSQKQSKGPLLHIHGQKFQFDNSWQTLTCLDKKPARKRIDIGGVTFISSSSGTSLTRTNYHTARSILVQAKQKSISLLTRKLKKNNEPCLFFHRFGRCSGKERGTCVRLHDPKNVAVCKRFVQDFCTEPQCLLSHVISCHNMPTCQHFLAGNCGRDNCPYPHIKVSDSAPICLDFLKGYCSLGDQCAKRHLEMCPSFEKGTCSRGKYCPYPHPKSKSNQKLQGKFKYLEKKLQTVSDIEPVSSCIVRYFQDLNLQKENQIQLNEDPEALEENCGTEADGDNSNPLKRRRRLGRLPSFIPLSFDNSDIDTDTPETVYMS